MSGASGEESGGDADSASLVGDSYDDDDEGTLPIEWQEIRGTPEGDEDDLLKDSKAQTSVAGGRAAGWMAECPESINCAK